MTDVDLNFAGPQDDLELDFAGVESGGGILAAGKYLMKVIECTVGKTKNNDKMIVITVSPDVDPNDPIATKKIKEFLSIVPARDGKKGTLWKVRIVLEAISGIEFEQGQIKVNPSELIGRRVWCDIVESTFKTRKDKTDPDSELIERATNNITIWEKDYDSIPLENIVLSNDFR